MVVGEDEREDVSSSSSLWSSATSGSAMRLVGADRELVLCAVLLLVGKSSRSSPSSDVDEDVEELRRRDISRADDDDLLLAMSGRYGSATFTISSSKAATVFRMALELAQMSESRLSRPALCWRMRARSSMSVAGLLMLLWLDGMGDADREELLGFMVVLLLEVIGRSELCSVAVMRLLQPARRRQGPQYT